MNRNLSFLFFFLLSVVATQAQDERPELQIDTVETVIEGKGIKADRAFLEKRKRINPLAPSKAAFYSAILPGLGQIYNRRYWKVPIVYAAIGTGVLVYLDNNSNYNRFRDAFKRRRAGFTDDEFFDLPPLQDTPPANPEFSTAALEDAQERFQRDRDLALVVTILLYALNVVDANVDAHLKQFNIDNNLDLDITPFVNQNPISANIDFGMTFTIKF